MTTPTQKRLASATAARQTAADGSDRSHRRWLMVGLCFFGLTINYVDRGNLGVALPKMKTDLGLGAGAEGVVLAAFFASCAVFQLPAGHAVDRWGEKIVNTFAVTWWSLFTALTAAAGSFATLIVMRLGLGAGESGGYPSSAKAVSVWFPTRARAFATSIYASGARVGTAAALPIVAALIAWLGWRGSFIITGAFGLVWVVFWLRFYRRPREDAGISPAELEYIEEGGARVEEKEAEEENRDASSVRYRDPAHVASIGGIQNFASNLAGVLGATTTGALVGLSGGSFAAALVLSGVLGLVGAFSYLVIVQRIEPLPVRA